MRTTVFTAVVCILTLVTVGCPSYEHIAITSSPSSSKVYIDGKYVGDTPFETHLLDHVTPSFDHVRHDVVVSKEGYRSQSRGLQSHFFFATARSNFPDSLHFDLPPNTPRVSHAVVRLQATIRNIHVLIIGVGDYDNRAIPGLKYAEADAKSVYDFFRSSQSVAAPRNVHFVGHEPNDDGLRATKMGITQAIEKYLIRRAVHENDMAVVFLAGHGDQDKAGTSYFFVPKDADPSSPLSTCLALSEFQRLLDRVPARTRLLIADTCHAGAISGTRNLKIRGIDRMGVAEADKTTIVFSSCSAGERAVKLDKEKHGLFTWVLLQGLRGNADSACGDGDERVTLGELQRWLKLRIPSTARKVGGKQTPTISLPQGWDGVYLTR